MSPLLKPMTAAVALLALAACGGADNPPTQASLTNTDTPTEAQIPMPTITPNADPIASTHPNSIQPETTLQISAEGYVDRDPDMAYLMTGVTSEAETAEAAMAANRRAMNGVFSSLEKAGVAKRDMQTSNFSMNPRYDYSNRDGQPPKLIGYTVSNQLSVRVRDLTTLGGTMDALVSAGGNTFSGLRFALDDETEARNEARKLAVNEAISRAELYASAAGYEVARIVTLSESGGYQPQPMMMMESRAKMADASTPIASGEVGYSISVNVTFELRKPADGQ